MDATVARVKRRIHTLERHIAGCQDEESKAEWAQEVVDLRELLRRAGETSAVPVPRPLSLLEEPNEEHSLTSYALGWNDCLRVTKNLIRRSGRKLRAVEAN